MLARSRPDRVQIANDSHHSRNVGSFTTAVAKAWGDNLIGGGDEDGEQAIVNLQRLVGRVVGLDAEGVFRLVVCFL